MRSPDLMHSEWRCDIHGPVLPLHVARHINRDVIVATTHHLRVPLWCPWPLLAGWTVTGAGWAGDDRSGGRASVLSVSAPGPLGGPADIMLIAEEPGIGLGARFAALTGFDPGDHLLEAVRRSAAHAKVKAAGHPTPLWSVASVDDRGVYVGEAKGVWLYAVAWPAAAAYLLVEDLVLHDLVESVPGELVFGAPCPYLHGTV